MVSLNELSRTAQLVSGVSGILIQVSLILEPVCSAHCTASRNVGDNTGITPGGEKQQYPRAFQSQMQYHQVLGGGGVILF